MSAMRPTGGQAVKTGYPGVSLNVVTTTPASLRDAIQAAVGGIEPALLRPVSATDAAPWPLSRAVLALLVYCYAHQIYSSAIAAGMAACDPYFPWPLWEPLPNPQALRRFRMENREAIQRCLEEALRFQGDQKVFGGTTANSSSLKIAQEAGRRITKAALTDSVELEAE